MIKYAPQQIYAEAMRIIEEKVVFFEDDLIAWLPCSKSTYYEHIKRGSDEADSIKSAILLNRVRAKSVVRRNLFQNADNPTAQIAFYKMICTPEEREALSTHNEVTTRSTDVAKIVFHIDPNDKDVFINE